MAEGMITTKVDDLIDLVEREGKVTLEDAAKKLGIPKDTLQAWVDFLVEEKILGVEYKFTVPYIYLHKPTEKRELRGEKAVSLEDFKKEFEKKALEKKIPAEKMPEYWRNHLTLAIDRKKSFFIQQCKKFDVKNLEILFEKYKRQAMI